MPLDQVQTAVQGFLTANWTLTDVAFENDGYEPQVAADGTIRPWLLVEVFGGLTEQRSIGAGSAAADLWTDSGVLWLHIFVASGTGSLLAKQYGAALAALFRGLQLDPDIAFGDIALAASGGSSNGNDWSLSASIDWIQG
jgi:uncharacterized protein DUF4128